MKALAAALLFSLVIDGNSRAADQSMAPLRVAFVEPTASQPSQRDPAVIFYDDFAALPVIGGARYLEYNNADGSFVWDADGGMRGGGMKCEFTKGQVTAGGLKVLFGRNPLNRGIRREETFNEIYWRVYVKHEPGWEGNPAKLARATCLAGEDWSQGFIAHVWGGKGEALCIDPATGIRGNVKVTTRYNDFDHLKWLGSREAQLPIFSAAESGRWVCVESHVSLNHPGLGDGKFELWVDDRLEANRTNLDWQGTWTNYAINSVFLENYWNDGSVKRQARWFDDLVISERRVGPILAESPPVITRTAGAAAAWELEIAGDGDGQDVVWRSNPMRGEAMSLTVNGATGEFSGSCANKGALATGREYWTHIRRRGESNWSAWHAPFCQ